MRIFDAMLLKREIGNNCKLEVKMLETLNDGIVLSIEEDLVNSENLVFLADFVEQHKLSLLLDNERYYISTYALTPSAQYGWDS